MFSIKEHSVGVLNVLIIELLISIKWTLYVVIVYDVLFFLGDVSEEPFFLPVFWSGIIGLGSSV